MQKEHIQELHQKYKDIWMVRQDAILRSHNAKVLELQELCQSKGQIQVNPDNALADLSALQIQVAQLLAQLATLGVQPVVSSGVAVPVELVTGAETIVSSQVVDLAGVNHDIVPGLSQNEAIPAMSSEEKEARIAHASSVTHKGKGKGSSDGVAY
jgi:NAD(P)-dependent dehydrogenase (short-subunit alcohol dehydrogenase family)